MWRNRGSEGVEEIGSVKIMGDWKSQCGEEELLSYFIKLDMPTCANVPYIFFGGIE